jgi:hypothetical protein
VSRAARILTWTEPSKGSHSRSSATSSAGRTPHQSPAQLVICVPISFGSEPAVDGQLCPNEFSSCSKTSCSRSATLTPQQGQIAVHVKLCDAAALVMAQHTMGMPAVPLRCGVMSRGSSRILHDPPPGSPGVAPALGFGATRAGAPGNAKQGDEGAATM